MACNFDTTIAGIIRDSTPMGKRLQEKLKRALGFKDLVREFVISDLRARYVGSTLGIFWSVVNPLLMLIVYTFVFSVVLGVRFREDPGVHNYALYLFCGMLPWLAFQESVAGSVVALTSNANLVKHVVFPVKALHASIILSALVSEVTGLAILLVFKVILYGQIGVWFLLLPLVILFQCIFTMGLSLYLSALNVFFRDTAPLVRPVLLIWMYMTPIFYPLSIVPERFRMFIYINPMTPLVTAYRDLLLNDRPPQTAGSVYFAVVSLLVFFAGYRFFTKNHLRFVDLI